MCPQGMNPGEVGEHIRHRLGEKERKIPASRVICAKNSLFQLVAAEPGESRTSSEL